MTDMPEKISAYIKVDNSKAAWHGRLWSYRLSGYGVEYIRADIHEKAVKERDALKAENERLRCALEHIANGCLVPPDGGAPTFDDLVETARKALQGGE